jgi:hypothetical protein
MAIMTPKTVDGILAGFTKLVDQLTVLAERKEIEATRHDDAMIAARDARDAAIDESRKAAAKAKQIADIFG